MARGGKRPGAGRKSNPYKGKEGSAQKTAAAAKSYDPSVAERAKKLCELGATDVEVADFFGISVTTVYRWKIEFPEFCKAMAAGKEACDARVEHSLYHRAIGYTFDAVKIMAVGGKVVTVPYREHVPPDTTAATVWLKNRRPDAWRDKVLNEHTGKDGGPIEVTKFTLSIFEDRPTIKGAPEKPDGGDAG